MEDLLVRRAVIFGLMRIKEDWVIKLLEKMQIEDSQWVVRTAATEALDELRKPSPYKIQPVPELENSPWLIAFAGKMGLGVIPGKVALDLMINVLERGDEPERLDALEFMRLKGDEYSLHQLYKTYYGSNDEVHENAFTTIWHYGASGLPLPPPTQFGLG